MTAVLDSLLSDLRARGAVFEAAGDRLHVDAPAGTLTEQDRAALTASKPELLQRLTAEAEILEMSLLEFERDGCPIEVRVPWLPETLWWVPRAEHVEDMVRHHVQRGRVYTARELTNLPNLPTGDESRADLRRIACLKAKLDGQILSVSSGPEVVTPRAASSNRLQCCRACQETRYWVSIYGATICGRCHPPASASLIERWVGGAEGSST